MMKYRISQLKLKNGESADRLPALIEKKTGARLKDWEIVRESIDARDKTSIFKVYTVDFETDKRLRTGKNIEQAPDLGYHPVELKRISDKQPVVIGFGPAGMFAALVMAQAGLKPIVLERGQDVETRTAQVEKFWSTGDLDVNSNVQFGEGGAGTFSDGKLTTGIKDIRIRKVLEELVSHGAGEDILYKAKPHVGTDVLRYVVRGIREDIIALGGEVRFGSLVTGIEIDDISVCGVKVKKLRAVNDEALQCNEGDADNSLSMEKHASIKIFSLTENNSLVDENCEEENTYILPTDAVVLAIGHSSRDTFKWLNDMGIGMTQKPFSMGVRIEHPQDMIDTAQYGRPARELGLPVADYKLNYRCRNGRGVYTFCMCPGGKVVVASSEEGMVVTNGMSYHGRDSGNANSAVLVDVRTEDFGSDDVLAGVEMQRKYERLAYENGLLQWGRKHMAPSCSWGELKDYRRDKSSENSLSQIDDEAAVGFVAASLPDFVLESMQEAMPAFGRKIKGFDGDDAKVTAVEARSSSPVRFLRNEDFEGTINYGSKTLHGFYPAGEGAGYAGGIMSAAVDGIKIAEKIISG